MSWMMPKCHSALSNISEFQWELGQRQSNGMKPLISLIHFSWSLWQQIAGHGWFSHGGVSSTSGKARLLKTCNSQGNIWEMKNINANSLKSRFCYETKPGQSTYNVQKETPLNTCHWCDVTNWVTLIMRWVHMESLNHPGTLEVIMEGRNFGVSLEEVTHA